MSYTFNWPCCMSAWVSLCLWGLLAGDFVVSTRPPLTGSSAPVGLRGYRRYFANDSLIGRPVPCTRDDKICFRHNLVFDPRLDNCQPTHFAYVNRTEFEHGSGRFVGATLKYADPCPGHRMAYDGVCYEEEIVDDVICGRDANITRHPFGGKECRQEQATPVSIQQPKEEGSCIIPDIRFPDTDRRVFYNSPYPEIQGFKNDNPNNFTAKSLKCGSDQASCFSRGQVFVAGYVGCHVLLRRGPCSKGHIVALDIQSAVKGHAEGTCVHVRGGCPKGYKRMLFDGQCHEDREIKIEAPSSIILNQFGNYIVTFPHVSSFVPTLKQHSCVINVLFSTFNVGGQILSPPCGANSMGNCKNHEVVHEPPKPEPST